MQVPAVEKIFTWAHPNSNALRSFYRDKLAAGDGSLNKLLKFAPFGRWGAPQASRPLAPRLATLLKCGFCIRRKYEGQLFVWCY
jgi:hypothetical protein